MSEHPNPCKATPDDHERVACLLEDLQKVAPFDLWVMIGPEGREVRVSSPAWVPAAVTLFDARALQAFILSLPDDLVQAFYEGSLDWWCDSRNAAPTNPFAAALTPGGIAAGYENLCAHTRGEATDEVTS